MPRDANGNYTLPAGNPVVSGSLITSPWANDTMPDLGQEITESLSREGKGAMTAPLKLVDESGATPGLAFNSEPTSGLRRESAGDLRLTALGVDVFRTNPATQGPDGWNSAASRFENLLNAVEDTEALAALSPEVGDRVSTKGYATPGDGGEASYLAMTLATFGAVPDEWGDHTAANGLVWELQSPRGLFAAQYGAVGSGDVLLPLQAWFNAARVKFDDGTGKLAGSMHATPGATYNISGRLLVPFGYDAVGKPHALSKIDINGYGATMIGSGSSDTDHDCFESAYWDGTQNLTTVGTAGESHLTNGTSLVGFYAENFVTVVNIQNWNQSCAVRDIIANNCQQVLNPNRCFYCELKNIQGGGSATQDTKPNFKFQSFVNIQPASGLVTGGHAVGFEINGADGQVFRDLGVESATYGMKFIGENSAVTLDNPYIEGCTGAGIKLEGTIRTLNIMGGFINQGANRIIDGSAIPSSEYVLVNFFGTHIESGDMQMERNIIGTFYGNRSGDAPFGPGGVFGESYASNPKIVNSGPEMVIDTSGSGYLGPTRLIAVPNKHIGVAAGNYDTAFGDLPLSTDKAPWQTFTQSGATPNIIYDFDTDISFSQNLMGTWYIRHTDNGADRYRHFFIMTQAAGAETVRLFSFEPSTGYLVDAATLYSGKYYASNVGGKLRLSINGISGSNGLSASLIRMF